MSRSHMVDDVLTYLDGLQNFAERNIRTVNAFVRVLKFLFYENECGQLCQHSFFIRYGSNREKTVVSVDADYDLIMVLPHPFTMDSFQVLEVEPGVYMLQLRKNYGCFGEYDKYLTRDKPRLLRAQNLRKDIFYHLVQCLSSLEEMWSNWNFSWKESLTNFRITLDNGIGRTINIDVIPQIGIDLQHYSLPGCDVKAFPSVVQNYIDNHEYSAFFVLAFPTNLQKSPMKHLFVHLNFGLLEMSCIEYSENVKNSVRVCKALSVKTGMKNYGFNHYHIKRMVVSLCESLRNYDPCEGIVIIFRAILNQLENGSLDGFFIKTQNVYTRNSSQRLQLCRILENIICDIEYQDEKLFTF